MEETKNSSPSSGDLSTSELIALLEKQIRAGTEATADRLQALHQEGGLDKETLKQGVQQALSLTQASLLLRSLAALLTPAASQGSSPTAGFFEAMHQAATLLKEIYQDQMMQTIDNKAAKILEQIQVKEPMDQKQRQVTQIVQDARKTHENPP